jgi:cytochrome P450
LLWLAQPVRFPAWCHRHGDPVTLRLASSPTVVVTREPELAWRFLTLPSDVATAAEENEILEPLLGSRSLLMRDGPDHVRLRHLLGPFFRGEEVKGHQAVIAEITRREVATWPRGQAFPLLPRMRALTLEVILRVVFGLGDSPRLMELRHALENLLGAGSSWLVPSWMRRDLPGSPWRRFVRSKARVDELLLAEVERLAADGRAAGVLAHLLQAREQGQLGQDELRDQLVTLLVAGHETTATSLAWSFELILRHPAAVERVRSAGDSGAYLDAVVKETLRLRPVFRLASRRLRVPLEVDRWTIPPGVGVGTNVYMLHRHPGVYPEPEAFRPERHLHSGSGSGSAHAWLPFGGGIRRCLGAAFAQFEMGVVLRTVLEEVQLRPATSEPEPVALHAVALVPKHGARVIAPYGEAT